MNSLLSITSFTYGSDPKAVACPTPLPSDWKHTQSGVEVGVCLFMSMCVQKHQKYNPGPIQHKSCKESSKEDLVCQ